MALGRVELGGSGKTADFKAINGRIWRKHLVSLAVLAGSGLYVWQVIADPAAALSEVPEARAGLGKGVGTGQFQDGTFAGSIEDAHYGDLQVKVMIEGGTITAIRRMKYPRHTSASETINLRVFRTLFKQAIARQSVEVDIVSGATYTSDAFVKSMALALEKAKA